MVMIVLINMVKHPGDRDNAGGVQHHRILFDKFHPSYFGTKVSQREFH